jgi:hypothetical protein
MRQESRDGLEGSTVASEYIALQSTKALLTQVQGRNSETLNKQRGQMLSG